MSVALDSAAAGPLIETIEATLGVTYSWGYQDSRERLRDLYDKAVRSQWNSDEVLDFSVDVDPSRPMMPDRFHPLWGSDLFERMTQREKDQLNTEMASWMLSQFLHGEQGALLAAAQLVTSVPDLDSKLYGATQVMDEARHVDVFNRYLHDKIGFAYPVSPHLKTLFDLILTDSRWDMKFLGMQIMVEGLGLSAFALMRQNANEPLLCDITRYVMSDEARHVAYGVLSLRDEYAHRSESDRREREDFVYEASVLMRDRFLMHEVWEKMGMPVERCTELARNNNGQILFRQWLFSKVVPMIKKIGLLSQPQRKRFEKLDILKYEDAYDPIEEFEKSEAERVAVLSPGRGATL